MTQSTSPDSMPSMTFLACAGGEEAAEHLDADRVAGEAVGERVAVLRRQQRRRGEDGDLLAVLDRLERGPDRDLGLAEADVAAHEAVHRVRPLHVGLDVVIATRWSGVSTNGNASSISCCHGVSWPNAKPSALTRCLVQHDELLGDLADGRADLALGLGEVAAAEAVQRRRLAADVLAQHVDLVGRDVQLVAALVGDEQVVALDATDRALDHALVLADAVLVGGRRSCRA